MARFGVEVEFIDKTKLLRGKVKKAMKDAVLDVTLDMKKVASASAPHASGFLEKNAQHNISVASQYVEGSVSFSAMHRGFNYAKWTHDANYKLGDKSKKKSGGKSKFGSGTVPVGKGYLENTLSINKAGYLNHLAEAYRDALS